MAMGTQNKVVYAVGDTVSMKRMFLYGFGEYRFLIRGFFENATFAAVKSEQETGENAVIVKISDGVREKTVPVFLGTPQCLPTQRKLHFLRGH